MKYVDYYAALGLARDASTEQIKKAYRSLAHRYHPDKSKAVDAEARFKEAAQAYATLKDPAKREAYDALGPLRPGEEMHAPPQWQAEHAGQPPHFDDLDLADILAAMGHPAGRGKARTRGPQHGRDLEHAVRISLRDAYHGTSLQLRMAGAEGERQLEVTIPAGVRDGQKLRLRGQGEKGQHGGADGDVYLHIALAPDPYFRVEHQDLHFDLRLTPWEAALGADIAVPTLDAPVMLSVPSGTPSGRKLRLRGRGLAHSAAKDALRGDMFARVQIDVPSNLTENERALFQSLADTSHFSARPPLG